MTLVDKIRKQARERAEHATPPPSLPRRIKRATDEYFFGDTPDTADALWFYGSYSVFITIILLISVLNVLL